MAGPWVEAGEVLDRLTAILQRPSASDLEEFWSTLVGPAVDMAAQTIMGELGARGFQPGQVDNWIRAKEFNRQIAIFFALTEHNSPDPRLQEATETSQRWLKDLQRITLIDSGGNPITPGSPTAAGAFGVGYGTLAAMADPCTGLNRFDRTEPRGLF